MIIRGAIGSIVSLSSNDKNGRLPGAICGDFAGKYISVSMSMSILVHAGASKWDRIKSVSWDLKPNGIENNSGSWATFSYVQTGVNATLYSRFGMFDWTSSLQYGDFMIRGGDGYRPNLACRNLWIDTSKSI